MDKLQLLSGEYQSLGQYSYGKLEEEFDQYLNAIYSDWDEDQDSEEKDPPSTTGGMYINQSRQEINAMSRSLWLYLLNRAGVNAELPWQSVKLPAIQRIANLLTNTTFTVEGELDDLEVAC